MTVFCRLKQISEDWYPISEKVPFPIKKIFKKQHLKENDEFLIHYSAFNQGVCPFGYVGGAALKGGLNYVDIWMAVAVC